MREEWIRKNEVLDILSSLPSDIVYDHVAELKGINIMDEDFEEALVIAKGVYEMIDVLKESNEKIIAEISETNDRSRKFDLEMMKIASNYCLKNLDFLLIYAKAEMVKSRQEGEKK